MVEFLASQVAQLQAAQGASFWERQLQPVERKEVCPGGMLHIDVDPRITNPNAVMCEGRIHPDEFRAKGLM